MTNPEAVSSLKRIGRVCALIALLAMAWFVWQTPAPAPEPVTVHTSLPTPPVAHPAKNHDTSKSTNHNSNSGKQLAGIMQAPTPELWRVVTRRIVWRAAVKALEQRLKDAKLKPIKLKRKEPVIMHAFDDASLFRTAEAAENARKKWLKKHIEATVIKANIEVGKDIYMVGLGRFFLTEYAEQIQTRLKQIGKPYRYERRTVTIPVYRFTFPAQPKVEAEKLWESLQDMGVATPVMMPEKAFKKAYGSKKR